MSDALVGLCLALGDDELILGHRHSEWTGFAPHIEEDVAFSSIAQDEIGHAAAFYGRAGEFTGDDPDRIALGREPGEYRNAILCERENQEWSYTLARHWLYDTADDVRLTALASTSDDRLRSLATKLRREERYHLLHAEMWMRRIAHGPVEGRSKLIDSLTRAFPEALGLFEPFQTEQACLRDGLLPMSSDDMRRQWLERATKTLDELGLPTVISPRRDQAAEFLASSSGDLIAGADDGAGASVGVTTGFGGRSGHHSDEFHSLWETMTSTYRAHEGATW